MLTNAGRTVILKALVTGKATIFQIAFGDGGADPQTGAAIAPTPDVTDLNAKIFTDNGIQSIKVISPNQTSKPIIQIRHTFNSSTVPSIGRDVSTMNEVGLYMTDPDTGNPVLVWIKTFKLKTGEKFRVPATGKAQTPDRVKIRYDIPISG